MKIAVIGPGSMGLLYGARLSGRAEVTLVGKRPEAIREIREHGVVIEREGHKEVFRVPAAVNGCLEGPQDLVILFTKAYQTREALEENRNGIGQDTLILTLQNGAGHEDVLREFADDSHVLIGTTTQGSSRLSSHEIVHSGLGDTVIGTLAPERTQEMAERLRDIVSVFEQSGFPCHVSDQIRYTVWHKLMINASSSVLSGILQVPQGYIVQNGSAWSLCQDLIREMCTVASGEGCCFDAQEQIVRIREHLKKAPGGYTSIYMDLKNGRKTEVDAISGAVVRAAEKQGVVAPAHLTMVRLVHAMESRKEPI